MIEILHSETSVSWPNSAPLLKYSLHSEISTSRSKFNSVTKVLTSTSASRLSSTLQLKSHFTRRSSFVCLEMELPPGVVKYASYSYHSKVRPPKGMIIRQHESSKIKTTYSFPLQDNVQLYFVKFHYVIIINKWIHEIFYIPVFSFWKRNTRDLGICHATIEDPRSKGSQGPFNWRRSLRSNIHPCNGPWST